MTTEEMPETIWARRCDDGQQRWYDAPPPGTRLNGEAEYMRTDAVKYAFDRLREREAEIARLRDVVREEIRKREECDDISCANPGGDNCYCEDYALKLFAAAQKGDAA